MDLDYWNEHKELRELLDQNSAMKTYFIISNEELRSGNYRLKRLNRVIWFLYFILFLAFIILSLLTISLFY